MAQHYLTAAQELREGIVPVERTNMRGVVASMPPDIFLDLVAVRLNGPKAEREEITINLDLTDIDELHAIQVRHGVLNHWPRHLTKPDATLTLSRSKLIEAFTAPALLDSALEAGEIKFDGDAEVVHRLVGLLDHFDPYFKLVEPNTVRDEQTTR